MTNAFNLLDNMDGLAASMGLVASGFFAIAAATVNPNRDIFVVSAALALACAGFLPFNLRRGKPAAVFMGDSGSQVIGLALGSLGLAATYKVAGTTLATLVLPLLVLAVPMLDTGLVTVLRLLEGRPVSQGGRDHTSHRLVYRGLSEKRAVLLLTAIATGPRRDEPGLHGARQRADHGRRRAAQLRAAAPVRAASSPTPSRRTTRA